MATRVSHHPRRRLNFPPLLFFILLSAGLHALLFLFFRIDTGAPVDDLVEVRLFDEGPAVALNPLQKPPAAEEKKKEEDKKEAEKADRPDGQVVDIARPDNEKRPDSYKFLAKWDSTVPREKRSAFDKDIPVRGKKLQRLATPPSAKLAPQSDELVTPGESKERKEKVEEQIKKGELAGFEGETGDLEKGAEKNDPGRITGTDKADKKGQEAAELSLPPRYLPFFYGNDTALTSPSNDYLKDLPEEDETAMNARRFLYADYYNRIKKAVSYYWEPAKVLMVHDPSGHIFGLADRYTKIEAVIDARGTIVSVIVTKPSGVDFLDREAIDAFKMAAPFPNPPAPLLTDGRFTLPFGFYVTIE